MPERVSYWNVVLSTDIRSHQIFVLPDEPVARRHLGLLPQSCRVLWSSFLVRLQIFAAYRYSQQLQCDWLAGNALMLILISFPSFLKDFQGAFSTPCWPVVPWKVQVLHFTKVHLHFCPAPDVVWVLLDLLGSLCAFYFAMAQDWVCFKYYLK